MRSLYFNTQHNTYCRILEMTKEQSISYVNDLHQKLHRSRDGDGDRER